MRQVFDSLIDLRNFIEKHPEMVTKKTPWKITHNGVNKFVLAGNSDQAIAAVVRQQGIKAEGVGMMELLSVV